MKTIIYAAILGFLLIKNLSTVEAETHQTPQKRVELKRSDMFPPENGVIWIKGKIINGRYFSPKNVFSCRAYDFGEGTYISQDSIRVCSACVGFYDSKSNNIKAEVMFTPQLKENKLDHTALKDAFNRFGINLLEIIDHAEGIEILKEEMINNEMFIAFISINKMAVLQDTNGKHPPATRGYLIFQADDKLVVLSNQYVTEPGSAHKPRSHIEKLKKEILDFKKTFEFGPIPDLKLLEEFYEQASEEERAEENI